MEDERDQKNFGVIMEIMTVNIDQHYFHNVYLRFAQTHIMKIMLINIHGTIPHNLTYNLTYNLTNSIDQWDERQNFFFENVLRFKMRSI